MLIHLTQHRHAFEVAAIMLPLANWTHADGDIGQCWDEDVALEDKASGATMVLHKDGTALFGIGRLVSVNVNLRGESC